MRYTSPALVSSLERGNSRSLGSPPICIHGQRHPLHMDTTHLHSYLKMCLQKHHCFIFTGGAWMSSWVMVLVVVKGRCCLILLFMVSSWSTSHQEPKGTSMAQ